jgi:hypothetical protein
VMHWRQLLPEVSILVMPGLAGACILVLTLVGLFLRLLLVGKERVVAGDESLRITGWRGTAREVPLAGLAGLEVVRSKATGTQVMLLSTEGASINLPCWLQEQEALVSLLVGKLGLVETRATEQFQRFDRPKEAT